MNPSRMIGNPGAIGTEPSTVVAGISIDRTMKFTIPVAAKSKGPTDSVERF
jgi:hypothetical protein